MGFLTMLDHIVHIVYAKMAKKLNEQNPLTLPKIRQPILAYTSYFFGAYQPKMCAAAADRVQGKVEGGESKGEGRKHGLENADLRIFYAGVRHLYAPAKCLFGVVVKTGKGSSNLFTFLCKKLRFRGFFKDIPKLDRLSCASRY